MRQFGSETIATADRQQTHELFVRYYSRWCLSADQALAGPDAGTTFAQLHGEFDNIREALRLSLEAGQLGHAAAIVSSMHDFGRRTVNGEPWLWAIDLVERVPAGGIPLEDASHQWRSNRVRLDDPLAVRADQAKPLARVCLERHFFKEQFAAAAQTHLPEIQHDFQYTGGNQRGGIISSRA